MAKLKHLSIGVGEPKRAAQALAELTRGKVDEFHPVTGGYVCLWPDWSGEFIEFYPKQVRLVPTGQGAEFKSVRETFEYYATHINLETALTSDEVKKTAARFGYKYHFRPANGGPLHEVWIENALLVELVTQDLK